MPGAVSQFHETLDPPGLALKASLLGKMSRLEVHHIFQKAKLYNHKREYRRPEVNALANFCFQTKDTNLEIILGEGTAA